jgi:hypothetical protein
MEVERSEQKSIESLTAVFTFICPVVVVMDIRLCETIPKNSQRREQWNFYATVYQKPTFFVPWDQ